MIFFFQGLQRGELHVPQKNEAYEAFSFHFLYQSRLTLIHCQFRGAEFLLLMHAILVALERLLQLLQKVFSIYQLLSLCFCISISFQAFNQLSSTKRLFHYYQQLPIFGKITSTILQIGAIDNTLQLR